MTFRSGIVGCGRIGSEFDDNHAGAYSAVGAVELVAVSDLNREKLEKCGKRWGVASLYQHYREMLAKEALDILSICTWNSTHLEIVREGVNHGVKAIYCEKPIADSLQHADEMIRLCNKKGVTLQINHQRRYNSFYQGLRSFLRKEKLGSVQQANFYYTRGVANTGSHMFDLLSFFFGNVDWVHAVYSENKSHDPKDPNMDGVMKFGSGVFCEIKACEDQNISIFEMELMGTKGKLNIMGNGSVVEYYELKESKLVSGFKELINSAPPIKTSVPKKPMIIAAEHLIECLEEGKRPISSGKDGRISLEIICAFHESAKAGGKTISLPLRDSNIEIKSS